MRNGLALTLTTVSTLTKGPVVKLNELKTAKQVRKEDTLQVRVLYLLGWPKNQVQILYLKWKVKHPGKWVVIDAQPSDKGDQGTK